MDLVLHSGLSIRSRSRWPNMIVFPKELRDAIWDYGSRALVFDSVSESHLNSPVFDVGHRAKFNLFVHEAGKLGGQFALLADLDTETTRALGQYLIDLADRAEARHG